MTLPYPIKYTYGQSETQDKTAAVLKEGWEKAGFKVTLDPLADTYYDVINQPDKDSDVVWAGWGADWPSAMTVLPPLFDSRANFATEPPATSRTSARTTATTRATSSTVSSTRPRRRPTSTPERPAHPG